MTVVIVVAALAVLALVTQAGVFLSERAYPAQGRMVEVEPSMSSISARATWPARRS